MKQTTHKPGRTADNPRRGLLRLRLSVTRYRSVSRNSKWMGPSGLECHYRTPETEPVPESLGVDCMAIGVADWGV